MNYFLKLNSYLRNKRDGNLKKKKINYYLVNYKSLSLHAVNKPRFPALCTNRKQL